MLAALGNLRGRDGHERVAKPTEIAATCGFPSTNFMRRIFLRHYHTTPLAFRKRHSG